MNPKHLKKLDADKFPLSGPAKAHNPLEVLQDGEEIIFEIRRHPAGILGLYLGAGFLMIFMAVVSFILVPRTFDGPGATLISVIVFFVIIIFSSIFVLISTMVYWGNHWIVTSDSLTQLEQTSFFHSQSSQLALDSLEDVTVQSVGVWAKFFGYGTLRAETAGESSKFVFRFCPKPNFYGQKLLAAREAHDRIIYSGEEQKKSSAPPTPVPPRNATKPTVEQLGQAALSDFSNNRDSKI